MKALPLLALPLFLIACGGEKKTEVREKSVIEQTAESTQKKAQATVDEVNKQLEERQKIMDGQ